MNSNTTMKTDWPSGEDFEPTVQVEPDRTLKIDWDDLTSSEVDAQVSRMREAQSVPLVRTVGEPDDEKPAWYRGQIAQMTLAGLLGGLLAWGLVELFTTQSSATAGEVAVANIGFTMLLGFGIGLVLAGWDGIVTRSKEKTWRSVRTAGPVLAVTTLIGGVIAHLIYSNWVQSIVASTLSEAIALGWTDQQFLDALQSQMHLPRGVAWAIVGLAVGVGLSLASRQRQRIINGAIGGLIGGFVGGALFDFFSSDVSARLVGIAITGAAIGLAIGLVEVARRQHWLEISSGGMAGKQFILYSGTTSVGASPECDVTLIKDPQIAPVHARLESGPNGLVATSADPHTPALVNGAVLAQQTLRDGDMLQFGSTLLRYREKTEQQVLDGPIAG